MNETNNNTLKSGTTLQGKAYTYTIRQMLGQGTFGITYLATTKVKVAGALGELETTMQVAIKEFFMKEINGREDNTVTSGSKGGVYDKYKKKFAREAENLSKLHHPNIVKVLEYFETNNTIYYAMEYVEGGNLDAYIAQRNGLPEAECVKYAEQIGSALSYMHAHKMLHLDLKPGNVMLRKNGDAVLIDFGLSKQYDDNGNPETSTTIGGGTPGYAPIEQSDYHEGKSFPVTMDVYALGATMYKMLTGVRAPEASAILNDGFPAYELQKHQVSDEMIAHIAKAMSALKKDRPQSVEAFLTSLGGEETSLNLNGNEDTIKPDKDIVRPAKPIANPTPAQNSSKNKIYIASGVAAVLIIAGIITYMVSKRQSDTVEDISLTEWLPTNDSLQTSVMNDTASITTHVAQQTETTSSQPPKKENPVRENVSKLEATTPNPPTNTARKNEAKPDAKKITQLAEQGDAEAQYELGRMYFLGKGMPRNATKALEWYQKAAEQGNALAQNELGNLYSKGVLVKQNIFEAAKWYQKAAEQGIANAQYNIGYLYDWGQGGLSQNRVEAIKWYKKASGQGNGEASLRLGAMYMYAVGVEKDEKEAIVWYKKAAEQENKEAMERLGDYYSNRGPNQNYTEAIKWYRMLVNSGNKTGTVLQNLAEAYEKVDNDTEAEKWYLEARKSFLRSAEKGDMNSMFYLGLMYQYGCLGIPKDKTEAIKWYRKAAALGEETAKKCLQELESE